jgi:xanthine dehydrogenase accessory factor
VVCGLNAIGQKAGDVCHRLELVKACLGIEDDAVITAVHIQKLVTEGYLNPMRPAYPNAKISVSPRHDGTLYQRAVASLLQNEQDVSLIREEWFCPQPTLFICGGGHVAKEVAALAVHLDFSVTVVDDREDLINRERFPAANRIICDSYDNLEKYLEPNACYVVVTPDHKADLQCVSTILPTDYRYLGMIGSKGKVAATFENLRRAGFSEEQIGTVFAPIGLPIGAVTPAEIALSILGQIVREKNKVHRASADKALLEAAGPGVLCVITEKQGSAPRGAGSMMLVQRDSVLGSIGGGEPEYLAIKHSREDPVFSVQEYPLNRMAPSGQGMVRSGCVKVAFIPLK